MAATLNFNSRDILEITKIKKKNINQSYYQSTWREICLKFLEVESKLSVKISKIFEKLLR